MNWIFADAPSVPGIYAVTHCWDAQEGLILDVLAWDGDKWLSINPAVIAFAGPFASDEEAKEWAHGHDMEA